MSKKEKLIRRLKSRPSDFSYDEAVTLIVSLGFRVSNKGKTSGSKVMFIRGNKKITIHKPHPKNELKGYQLGALIKDLEMEGLI